MAYIQLSEGLPGIRGLFVFSPATAQPLCDLAEVLLRAPNTLTRAEREMIATYVSARNDCHYCQTCHGSAAAQLLGGGKSEYDLVERLKRNLESSPISDKLKSLLNIAGKVQAGGKQVTAKDVDLARSHGASDKEIHDTVLIGAAFCMFNRYVDSLNTWQPDDPDFYREAGKQTAALGYVARDWKLPLHSVSTNKSANTGS